MPRLSPHTSWVGSGHMRLSILQNYHISVKRQANIDQVYVA